MARPSRSHGPTPPSRPRPSEAELVARLHRYGVARPVAEELVAEHPARRVIDALDVLEEIERGPLRAPAGWLDAAIRGSWDLTSAPADRRRSGERLDRWERDQLEREDADTIARRKRSRARAWYGAVADALDDAQLETAIEHVTTPVAGIGRRSVPLARAQLVAWAVDVRDREPDAPFDKALRVDLESEPRPVMTIGGVLPRAPYVLADAPDLGDRIDAALLRRPDLERPDVPQPALAPPGRDDRSGLELER